MLSCLHPAAKKPPFLLRIITGRYFDQQEKSREIRFMENRALVVWSRRVAALAQQWGPLKCRTSASLAPWISCAWSVLRGGLREGRSFWWINSQEMDLQRMQVANQCLLRVILNNNICRGFLVCMMIPAVTACKFCIVKENIWVNKNLVFFSSKLSAQSYTCRDSNWELVTLNSKKKYLHLGCLWR